jgi:hypothetical protein
LAYSIGTISLTQNSNVVTGANTYFQQVAKAESGNLFYVELSGSTLWLQVAAVTSDSELRVSKLDGSPFVASETVANLRYGLIQNFTATQLSKIAANVAELQKKWHLRESQLTDWFASQDESAIITSLLGEQITVPTPAEIARLAEVASLSSSQLAAMADAIAANQASLATVNPRLDVFEQQYAEVAPAHANVVLKHNDVVQKHADVVSKAGEVSTAQTSIEQAKQTVLTTAEQVALDADTSNINKLEAIAAAKLSAVANQNTEADKQAAELAKSDVETLAEQLNQSLTAATSSINTVKTQAVNDVNSAKQAAETSLDTKAVTFTQTVNAQTASVEQTAATAKQQIDDRAASFEHDANTKLTTITELANQAETAKNRSVVAQNRVVIAESHVADMIVTVADYTDATEAAAQATQSYAENAQAMAERAELSELHCRAYASLNSVALDLFTDQNTNINTAFKAVLNGTLTNAQIDSLF